jgi:hypothetical protein
MGMPLDSMVYLSHDGSFSGCGSGSLSYPILISMDNGHAVRLHGVLDHSHDGSSRDADPKEPYLTSMDMPWDSMVYLITAMMVLLTMRIRKNLT